MAMVVEVSEAQAKLKELIARLKPNEEIVITENDRPIAHLKATAKPQPQFGSCRGMITVIEEDEEHLEDFKEYMP